MPPYLRRRILLAFERAETEPDADERRRLLNFVVVGGGPTGVEMAGAIAELAKRALASDFRAIDPRSARIILVEAAPRLLHAVRSIAVGSRTALARTARRRGPARRRRHRLRRLGVLARRGTPRNPNHHLGRRRQGLARRPSGSAPSSDRAGRVKVQPDLSVPGHPDVFVIGDAAAAMGPTASRCPASRRSPSSRASTSLSC